MKKTITLLFILAVSFTSFAQSQKNNNSSQMQLSNSEENAFTVIEPIELYGKEWLKGTWTLTTVDDFIQTYTVQITGTSKLSTVIIEDEEVTVQDLVEMIENLVNELPDEDEIAEAKKELSAQGITLEVTGGKFIMTNNKDSIYTNFTAVIELEDQRYEQIYSLALNKVSDSVDVSSVNNKASKTRQNENMTYYTERYNELFSQFAAALQTVDYTSEDGKDVIYELWETYNESLKTLVIEPDSSTFDDFDDYVTAWDEWFSAKSAAWDAGYEIKSIAMERWYDAYWNDF